MPTTFFTLTLLQLYSIFLSVLLPKSVATQTTTTSTATATASTFMSPGTGSFVTLSVFFFFFEITVNPRYKFNLKATLFYLNVNEFKLVICNN